MRCRLPSIDILWTDWTIGIFINFAGDYRECIVVVWETKSFQQVASSSAVAAPVHGLLWDPYTVNEFVTVGEAGTVMFWLLGESGRRTTDVRGGGEGGACTYSLSVQEAELPLELSGSGRVS